PDPLLAAAAKVTVNEMARRVTSDAIQVHGGYGFTDEFPVSRFYRGARYGTLGGGTSETLRDLVGKRVIAGLDPVVGILGLGAFCSRLYCGPVGHRARCDVARAHVVDCRPHYFFLPRRNPAAFLPDGLP